MISYWKKKNLISFLLLPLSWIYYLISKLIALLAVPKKFSKKIICIGNITAGGAGKTPTAIAIAKELQKINKKVVFAVRNYKSASAKNFLLTAKDTYDQNIVEEAFLLAEVAPTYVAPKRLQAIESACESDADFVIVDDGMQNPHFAKDVKILVIDGVQRFGNGMLMPAGPLRDLQSSVGKADIVVKINFQEEKLKDIYYADGVMEMPSNFDSNAKYIAFAAIGCPEKFFMSLRREGVDLIEEVKFPDHHIYNNKDYEHLRNLASEHKGKLITTRKDAIKLKGYDDIVVVDYKIIFENAKKIIELVTNASNK